MFVNVVIFSVFRISLFFQLAKYELRISILLTSWDLGYLRHGEETRNNYSLLQASIPR